MWAKTKGILSETNLKKSQKQAIFWGILSTITVVVIHIIWAISSSEPENFQRGGSLIVVVEFLLFARVKYYSGIDNSKAYLGGRKSTKLDFLSATIAVFLASFGTVIWGYGDLFFKLFFDC